MVSPFLLLYGVVFLNSVSLSVVFPSLYNFATTLGINPALAAFYFSAYGIAQFLAAPVLGRISDTMARRPVLLLCTAGTALASLVQASVAVPAVLIIVRVLDGATGGNNSVAEAALSDLSTPQDRARVYAGSNAAFGAGFLAGPLLNWWLVSFGLQMPFVAAAALATLATVLLFNYFEETLVVRPPKRTSLLPEVARIFTNLQEGLFTPLVGIIFAYMFVYAVVAGSFYFSIQPYVLDVLGEEQGLINAISSLFGGANVLIIGCLPYLQRFTSGLTILLILSVLRSGVLGVLPGSLLVFVTSAGLICFLNAFTRPILTTLVSLLSADNRQGQNLGTLGSFFGAGFSFGPLLSGAVITQTGLVSVPFYLGSGLTALVTLFLWRKKATLEARLTS